MVLVALCAIASSVTERLLADTYHVQAQGLAAGGLTATTGVYRLDSTIGGLGGGTSGTNPVLVTKHGYWGQINNVLAIELNASPSNVFESGTSQLAGVGSLDDNTHTVLTGSDILWQVLSGSIASIDSNGLATAGSVASDLPATIKGYFLGATNLVVITILNAVPPVASFTGSPTSGIAPLLVTFTDQSTGTITNRIWTFGDGTSSNLTENTVFHTYTTTGTNSVTLQVQGPEGSNSLTRTAYILVTNTGPPVAQFAGSPTNGPIPLLVAFTNLSTGSATSFLWAFGDGNFSTNTHPNHTYLGSGSFTVSLTAYGPIGTNTNTRSGYINATDAPPDIIPPALTILSPTNNSVITNAAISVAGTASDPSGVQAVTVNGLAATLVGSNWSRAYDLLEGTNLITVIATDNSVNQNSATQSVQAVYVPGGPPPGSNAPLVHIVLPTDGTIVTNRFVDVSGTATDDQSVVLVVVTNSCGGSLAAALIGTNWTANNVLLRVGTNMLFAVATDDSNNRASDVVTVIRVNTNYVNTTLQTLKASLELGSDASITLSGIYNDADITFNSTNDTVEVLFGDYEAMLSSNTLSKLKYKASASATNTLTSFALVPKKRGFSFSASGFTLTNGEPYLVAIALGTNDLGPDSISFAGQSSWNYGTQLPNVDQFFLGKSKLTTNSFKLTGTVSIQAKPDPRSEAVCFGIGNYDEMLPTNGWVKASGNAYSYERPAGHTGNVESMMMDFDEGTWSARGSDANLGFLPLNPTTDVRLEIGEFAASYRAALRQKGTKFSY